MDPTPLKRPSSQTGYRPACRSCRRAQDANRSSQRAPRRHRSCPRATADGDCWHTQTDYEYRPEMGLTVHPEDWKWKEGEHHQWREHAGKGYWKDNAWKEF